MENDNTTTTTGTGTTSTEGETSTTGQTSGTTSTGSTQTQNNTSQQNSNSTGQQTQSQVKTLISDLPEDIQTYIKEMRRKEEAANKKAKDEQTARTQAEEAKLLEDGKYKDLLSKRDTENTTLKAEVARLQREILVAKVVKKHELPVELENILTGTTEAELEENALLLVKHIKPKGVNTEGGRGNGAGAGQTQNRQNTGAGQGQNNTNGQQAAKTYSFQKPGEVPWPF